MNKSDCKLIQEPHYKYDSRSKERCLYFKNGDIARFCKTKEDKESLLSEGTTDIQVFFKSCR